MRLWTYNVIEGQANAQLCAFTFSFKQKLPISNLIIHSRIQISKSPEFTTSNVEQKWNKSVLKQATEFAIYYYVLTTHKHTISKIDFQIYASFDAIEVNQTVSNIVSGTHAAIVMAKLWFVLDQIDMYK